MLNNQLTFVYHSHGIGGTPDSQREFLDTLASDPSDPRLPSERRKAKAAPIANQFALGYTYQDVLDTDQEGRSPVFTIPLYVRLSLRTSTILDILARVSVYLLSEPSPSFASLLKPLLNPKSVRETLIVILLDWDSPWLWVRQLRDWIRLLRTVLFSLDDDTKLVMEEVMTEWKGQRRGMESSYPTGSGAPVSIPLGPGEWDEGLGIPMCVVCQGVSFPFRLYAHRKLILMTGRKNREVGKGPWLA